MHKGGCFSSVQKERMKTMAVEFRFAGGPHDGKAMRDDVYSHGQHLFVEKWWVATNEGSLGAKFQVFSEKGSQEISEKGIEADFIGHFYEITNRQEVEDDTVVECEYRKAERLA